MIDAKELRIGNWVDLRGSFTPVGYGYIGDLYQIQKGQTNDYLKTVPPAYGIPLTTEILEKCMFEHIWDWDNKDNRKNDCSMFLDLGYLYIAQNIMGGITLFQYDSISTGVNFNYLHHLQNCYYALTGKELEIKL